MKILHILSERGYSGGEHQLEALVRHLVDQGHENRFLLQPGAEFRGFAEELGLPVTEVRMRNGIDLFAARAMSRELRAHPVDLVQFACSRSHKIAGLLQVLPGELPPVVVTRRMDYPIKQSAYRRWLYGRVVDAVVVISKGVGDEVLRLGVDPGHIHLIHDGVDTEGIARSTTSEVRERKRSDLGLTRSDLLGVTLASLHERKGQDVLLRALSEIEIPEGRQLHWFLGGQGPLLDSLRQQAQELHAARPDQIVVHIPGEQVDAPPLLAAADLFCLPSRHEGMGVALLEAMAADLPVVASRVGGMVEAFVDGVSGLHVDVEDTHGLASALASIVADPERAASLGAEAKARVVAEFDISKMCQKTEALYLSLAQQTRGR